MVTILWVAGAFLLGVFLGLLAARQKTSVKWPSGLEINTQTAKDAAMLMPQVSSTSAAQVQTQVLAHSALVGAGAKEARPQ